MTQLSIAAQLVLLPALALAEYNLINPNATCYYRGLCEHATPYTMEGTHPNAEERQAHAFMNFARLLPDEYAKHPFGEHKYGKYGPQTTYAEGCGEPAPQPMWMWEDANELARFHAYGCSECDGKCKGHDTCTDDCHLFGGSCGFGDRADAFRFEKGKRMASEGLCGANMCLTSGHCGAIFEKDRTLVGFGVAMNRRTEQVGNGMTNVYVDGDAPEKYPIVSAAHFDLKVKVHKTDFNRIVNDKNAGASFAFMVVYFSQINPALRGRVWFKGQYHEMYKEAGTNKKGVWISYLQNPNRCEPYFFLFEAQDGTKYRMPQNPKYFFGTAWMPYVFEKDVDRPICDENHYFVREDGSAVANSGPGDKSFAVQPDSNYLYLLSRMFIEET